MLRIEIYTKLNCSYCDHAKKLLDSKGFKYTEIRIDTNSEHTEEMLQRTQGRRSVPQIFMNDRLIGGFDDLLTLDQAGKLDILLSE